MFKRWNNSVNTGNTNLIFGYANRYNYYMYDGTYWVFYGTSIDANDNSQAWQVRHNNGSSKVFTNLYRYMLLLTKSEDTFLPVNAVDNSTATTKTLTTEEFDPFGEILFYNSATTITAGNQANAAALFTELTLDLRYSFNTGTTLTANKSVFIVAVPQSNGKAKLHSSPITQELPTTKDDLIYIYLGRAYSAYQIELANVHPIYEFAGGKISLYTGNAGGGFDVDAVYPVGSIYMSVNNTDPGTLFGGTWQSIPGRFLIGAGQGYTAGDTGGEATHTLTVNEMPAHNHQLMSQDSGGSAAYNNWHAEFKFANNTNVNNLQSGSGKVTTASGPTTGGGQAHNNMPPYLVVYIFKRTA